MFKSKYNISLTIMLIILCFIMFLMILRDNKDTTINVSQVTSTQMPQKVIEKAPTYVYDEMEPVKEIPSKAIDILSTNLNHTNSYYIKVNNQANVVTIYTKDNEGNLNPYRAMICSTGTHTPKEGKYPLQTKWEWGALQHNVYGHYVTKITGNILFHSVPYEKYGRPDSLQFEEFDKLGTSASLGCVRLQIVDTKWIFDNIPQGTIVEFYSSEDPGPLGKPYAPKISNNVDCRNWDPTELSPSSPWKKQLGFISFN